MTKKSFTFDTEKIAPLITAGLKFVEELANAANTSEPVNDLNDKIGDKLNGCIYETWDDVPYGVEVEGCVEGNGSVQPVYRLVKVSGWLVPFFRILPDGKYTIASNNDFHAGPYIRYV